MNHIVKILLLAVILSGCGAKPYMMPHWKQPLVNQGIQGASTVFNEGWSDGCQSGSATSTNYIQRLYYGFKMNDAMVENDEYYNAWNKGFRYCHRYLYQYHRKVFSN